MAHAEYRTYLTRLALNASAEEATPRRPAATGLVAALAVLTPPVAASSAAVLLVLGYLLQLADVRGTLPNSLVTAGWILALVAALSTLIALAALLGTAIRGRGPSAHPAGLEQARLDWQQALLERGMLPHLRRYLDEDPSLQSAHRATPSPLHSRPRLQQRPFARRLAAPPVRTARQTPPHSCISSTERRRSTPCPST